MEWDFHLSVCLICCILCSVCDMYIFGCIIQMMKVEQNKHDVAAKGRRDAKSAMNRIKGKQ